MSLLSPELAADFAIYVNIPSTTGVIWLFRFVALLQLPIALAYLLAAIVPEASRSLLIVATFPRVISMLSGLWSFFAGTLSGALFNKLYAGWIMDGIFAIAGIYAVVVTRKPKGASA